MNTLQAIMSRRSKRKYVAAPVSREDLTALVDYARFAPSAANLQPLKFAIIDKEETVKKVFSFTKWSGYVPEGAPTENEQPPAYIAIFGDKGIKKNGGFETDAGAAMTIISLAAEEMKLSACILGAINRDEICKLLKTDENLELLYLVAVGYSVQEGKAVAKNSEIKYFIDENGVLNVPKRQIDEILINI